MIPINDVIEFFELQGLLKKDGKTEKIPIKKPCHGNCCTCQVCGYAHEDCVCEHNETVDWIKKHCIKLRDEI